MDDDLNILLAAVWNAGYIAGLEHATGVVSGRPTPAARNPYHHQPIRDDGPNDPKEI